MTQQPHDNDQGDAERRHLRAVDTPPDGVPAPDMTGLDTTGLDTTAGGRPDGGSGDEGPGSGLRAGDALGDVEALASPAVDAHLIPLPAPTMAQRWAARSGGERARLLPGWATDARIAREAAARTVRDVGHVLAYRALRAPWDGLRLCWYALVGARRIGWRLTRWAFDVDGHPLIGAVTARDDRAYVRMAHDRTVRQKWRMSLLGVLALAVVLGVLAARVWAPGWVLPALVVLVVLGLARHGKPVGVTLLSPAVRRDVRIPLTSQAIVRALSVLGIGPLTKALAAGSDRIWRSGIADVRGGHVVQIQLPLGVLAVDLIPHEQRMAHALGRRADCVIVEPLPERTPGDLKLHILDRPALVGDRGPGPLAKARKTSWWRPVQVGITRLGQPHYVALRGGAWSLGGQPASGKSSLLKIAAAHTALDPYAMLTVINLKGSPEYVAFKGLCHRYLSGAPETDPTIIPQAMALLREILADCAKRNDFLTKLVEEGKADSADVTEELARQYPLLRPHTIIFDEVHRLFDRSDNPEAEEAAELYAKAVKAVRSVAETLIAATQLAGGESVPPALPRASRIRGCLTVQDEISFRQIFGNSGRGAFAESGVASLSPGTVILKAEDGAALKVGTYLIKGPVMAEIGRRALALRSDLRLLTGDAVGDRLADVVPDADPADLLRDVLAAIPGTAPVGGPADADAAWLAELEVALTELPAYTGRAPGWLGAELKARKVPTTPVNRRVPTEVRASGQRNEAGVKAGAVRKALEALLTD
jgi:S-DNA-T family DNA segregation ATPase FtsK/SpoIIIE